ncbi:FAD-dependent oxidoreductase [Pelagibius litoralis]|uniref:FAD-dependent oxidoreductase n=1 Tax=Pelagibius litoralis TaxID=374515 RepID=A0A967EWR5_9PROT|nr:FAD-dependent oxidoreductase [Pelagibius litoralis]NIA67983.1 FAD-dependent oxidoreductase [Pelagibius litoralis]
MKVLIVGGGIVGLSTAWALVRQGHDPVLLEQGPLPQTAGASYDQHRLIRLPYADQLGYCAMVVDAFKAWSRLWDDLGESHYAEIGSLAVSTAANDWADLSRLTLDRLGLGYETLDAKEIEARCPFMTVPAQAWGLLNQRGGLLFASRIVEALVRYLQHRGVSLRAEHRIVSVDPGAGCVTLENGNRESAEAIVVTAGAWTAKLFPELARRAVAHRQVVAYLEPPESQAEAWAAAPAMVHLLNEVDIYAAPPVAGTELKFGAGKHRRPGDPDRLDPLGETEAAEVAAAFRPLLKDFDDYRILRGQVCPYAVSPDDRFVTERNGGVTVIGGCSGHMFKFGALMGEELAKTAIGERPYEDFRDWAEGRREGLSEV